MQALLQIPDKPHGFSFRAFEGRVTVQASALGAFLHARECEELSHRAGSRGAVLRIILSVEEVAQIVEAALASGGLRIAVAPPGASQADEQSR